MNTHLSHMKSAGRLAQTVYLSSVLRLSKALAILLLIGLGASVLAQPSAPAFSSPAGIANTRFIAQITCSDSDVEIHYTTDGTDPTQSDTPIDSGSSVCIGRSLTLKARAWDLDGNASSVASAVYTLTGQIACGAQHVIALKSNGTLFAWGQQTGGRLGNGLTTSASVLLPVHVLKSGTINFSNVADIAAGNDHNLVLDSGAVPWTFGNNGNGQLGNNTKTASAYPVRVLKSGTAGDYLTGISQVAGGTGFSLATGSDGRLWAWGTTANGCLGNGATSGDQLFAVNVTTSGTGNPKLTGVVQAAAGATFALAVDGVGQIWSWGSNANGQLGIGSITQQARALRVKVSGSSIFTGASAVAAGISHSVALCSGGTNNGSVWCWGLQTSGRLGNGQTAAGNIMYPVRVRTSGSQYLSNVVEVAAGPDFCLALDASAQVWAWGNNSSGNLGDGTTTASAYAKLVPLSLPTGVTVTGIRAGGAAGYGYGVAALSDGSLRAWGYNGQGELATNNTTTQKSPVIAAAGFCLDNQAPVLSLDTGGTYTSPANATLTANATDNDGRIDRVDFYLGSQFLGSDTVAPYTFQTGRLTAGNYAVSAVAYDDSGASSPVVTGTVVVADPVSPATPTRYSRGLGTDPTYHSYVVAVDFEKGVRLDATGNNFQRFPEAGNDVSKLPWFLRIQKYPAYQITNISGTIGYTLPFENPLVAFGAEGGGSPLYTGQSYTFGVGSGGQFPGTAGLGDFTVTIYDKTSLLSGGTTINLPRKGTQEWEAFAQKGYVQTLDLTGNTLNGKPVDFKVVVQYVDGQLVDNVWGQSMRAPLLVTVLSNTTDLYFKIGYVGFMLDANKAGHWMAARDPNNPNATGCSSVDFTLDFQQRPPWSSVYIDQPHFQGTALPPAYQGKSLEELLHNAASVQDTLVVSNTANMLTLNGSPELRSHPILDQFVADMGNDPLALVNYVLNEIELTDAISYNDNGAVSETSINPGGVNRGALATLLEAQGSPTEQCALTVYLLRKAGVPCGYVFGQRNGLLMLDTQLSKLLRMQIKGAQDPRGNSNVPHLVPTNYPWVAAYVGGKWVHIFPWLKDTAIEEGLDLFQYLPDGYQTGRQWIWKYLLKDPAIRGLSEEYDNPGALFPLYVKKQLQMNHPDVSIDQLGVTIYNRKNYFTDWQDLPRPWKTPMVTGTNLVQNLNSVPNLFDTMNLQVFSDRNGNGVVDSGEPVLTTGTMRSLDLHNRRLLLYCLKTGSNMHSMKLSLEPFRPGTTGTGTFLTTDTLLPPQLLATNLTSADDSLLFNITYERHRSLPRSLSVSTGEAFLATNDTLEITDQRPLRKGDMAAFVLNYGRVTSAMLNVQAKNYSTAQQAQLLNPSAPVSLEVSAGLPAYLMGLSYYQNVSQSLQQTLALTKTNMLSFFAHGFSKVGPQRMSNGALPNAGVINLIYPKLDMSFQRTAWAGYGLLHPDSGQAPSLAKGEWLPVVGGETSAQEHRTINKYFQKTDAISTVKLLDLSQGEIPAANVVSMDKSNYLISNPGSPWNTYYTVVVGGTSQTRKLAAWAGYDANNPAKKCLYKTIVDGFSAWDADYQQVLITPGPVTGAGGCYQGMGAFVLGIDSIAALITDNLVVSNGGWASQIPVLDTQPLTLTNSYISPDSGGSFVYLANTVRATAPAALAQINFSAIDTKISTGQFTLSPYQTSTLQQSVSLGTTYSFTIGNNASTALAYKSYYDIGSLGATSDNRSSTSLFGSKFASDPVNMVTGEFYIDATDLRLAGPMPLDIRRNYGSQNLADGNFGYGWKLAYVPYLVVSQDQSLIYAAEMDGSVVAYRRQTSSVTRWVPTAADNPHLANIAGDSTGSTANVFNNRIDITTTSGTNYTLTGVDGSVRTFLMQSFATSGTNGLTRRRPYLQKWQDNRGNFYSFTFGQDSNAPEYGQLTRVVSSNGNFAGFKYDIYGHIIEAFSGDGRRLYYKYDDYGDLIRVTLPDSSSIAYVYSHKLNLTGTGDRFYSEHLITEEAKPGGRMLTNVYDDNRRVTQQAATVGRDFSLVTNATMDYVNVTGTDGTISGYTLITDVNQHQTRYDYLNGQITQITDPLGQSIVQTWFQPGDSLPGTYPRSLKSRTDKRGLLTEFQYDAKGNLVQKKDVGNLTGTGSGEVAVSTFAYNSLNMVTSGTDSLGNVAVYTYDNTSYPYLPTSIEKRAPGGTISTTQYQYQTVVSGSIGAYGLLQTLTTAAGSPDQSVTSFTNNARGFVTSSSRSPGTGDPTVTISYTYNLRGELISQTDAANRSTKFAYDGRGNCIWQERRDEMGALVAWQYDYYNQNGEIEWSDGPRFDPEDYVLRRYDAAGRLSEEIKWRTEAQPDGGGVRAVSGVNDAYATTFYMHDAFGNLTEVRDPRHNSTTMQYDAIGQMTASQRHDGDANAPVLSSESFQYEPGGQVSQITNPLGGVTKKYYTSRGQLRRQENPDGTTQQWAYDFAGRKTLETFSNGTYRTTVYDDLARMVTSTLFNSGGVELAVETEMSDRRGNVISKTDAENNTFTTTYDALDRVKTAVGPAASGSSTRQTVTCIYDAAGVVSTVLDGLGNKTQTTSDAEGRPVLIKVKNGDGTVVNRTSWYYTPDHQLATTYAGTGTNSVITKVWTDNAGQPVLVVNADGTYRQSVYDANENLLTAMDEVGNVTSYTYDALNRRNTETLPATAGSVAATTTFVYDEMGNVLQRRMPGGNVQESGYDNAGRKTSEELRNGDTVTRQFGYSYYPAGMPFVGRLETVSDARGVTLTSVYDDFMRPQTVSASGAAPEQCQSTTYIYDRRGLVTEADQAYVDPGTGPSTTVSRSYDGYGQLAGEMVRLSGTTVSQWSQTWNAGAQRTALNWQLTAQGAGAGSSYNYAYRADGLLSKVTSAGTPYRFTYGDNGLLSKRANPWRTENVVRDARGRVSNRSEVVGAEMPLSETASRYNNSQLRRYTAMRDGNGVWNETKNYEYYSTGHLLVEQYMPVMSGTWEALYLYDNAQETAQGPLLGVRTASQLTALPDTTNAQPGTYGFYETFGQDAVQRPTTENLALQVNTFSSVQTAYDEVGNVTWRQLADGSTQTLVWDGLGRMVKVTQLDSDGSNGLVWTASYDGLGRRIQTETVPVLAGVADSSQISTIQSFYDPMVEFLELGVSVNGVRTWKVQGPDLNGGYGSLQGIGGLEATVDEASGSVTPVINDAFGNVVATISGTTVLWNPAQASSYGVVTGTAPMLSGSVSLPQATLWRSHRIDPTGFYYMGARYYEPQSGRFISPDPLGHGASASLYDYAGGDPVNGLDPDGRFGVSASNPTPRSMTGNTVWQTAFPSAATRSMHIDVAQLCNAVYEDDGGVRAGLIPANYSVVSVEKLSQMGLNPRDFADSNSGFFSVLYQNNITGHYIDVYRGTESKNDWSNNIAQGVGFSAKQYTQAIDLALKVSRVVGQGNITYAGHSLGGGMATGSSLVTQSPAITFNAAAVSNSTLARYHANASNANQLITSFYIPGEMLSGVQAASAFGVGKFVNYKTFGILNPVGSAQGNRIRIDPVSGWNHPIDKHSMNEFISSMSR